MKEKETWKKTMAGVDNNLACARAEDLVSYLYGEADAAASQDFEAHAQHCASCRSELAAFGQVRVAIGEWRGQALGSLASTVAATSSSVVAEPSRIAHERKRSALSAIREFFTLSPMWMRAATATLAVVFCALIALAVVHFIEQPKTITVEKTVKVMPSEAELARLVEERFKQQNEIVPPGPENNPPAPTYTPATVPKKDSVRPRVNRALRPDTSVQPQLVVVPHKLKISPQESREIARDLRLASNEEDDSPRLSDLIDESN